METADASPRFFFPALTLIFQLPQLLADNLQMPSSLDCLAISVPLCLQQTLASNIQGCDWCARAALWDQAKASLLLRSHSCLEPFFNTSLQQKFLCQPLLLGTPSEAGGEESFAGKESLAGIA